MKSVLLIDDDRICNFLTTKTLERMGLANGVHTAMNGKQAIELFSNYFIDERPLPDIILLDLNMPIMDGFGFLEAFKNLDLPAKSQVKIIVLSSSVNLDDIARAKRSGASLYLSKPIEERSLRRAMGL